MLPKLINTRRICRKLNKHIYNNKQHINIQPLNNDFLGKIVSREKTHTPKHTQCIIQQLTNGYSTL
jgi:hypothetical protein